jgi:hypothetical protein
MAGAHHRHGESLLRVLPGPGFWALLSEVLHLLPLQRQALSERPRLCQTTSKRGIAYEALDNGILSCADPWRVQAICDGLSAEKIDALLRKWFGKVPHPFTARDRQAGYRYQISILQAEFSLTQVLDRPQTGRVFFERGDSREPGHRQTESSAVDLRSPRQPPHPAAFGRGSSPTA